jgi:lysozyme family protein
VLIAAVAVLTTACGGGDQPSPRAASTPATTTPSSSAPTSRPVGSPTTLPWWSAGRLHVEGGVIATPLRQIVTAGGTTIVGRTTDTRSSWQILRGDRLVPLVARSQGGVTPVVSADGLHVAWTTSRTLRRLDRYRRVELATVTAYDVSSGHRVASTDLRSRTQCCDQGGVIGVLAVANDGSVLVHRNDDLSWVWRPGRDPVPVRQQARLRGVVGGGQWPGGVTWLTTDDGAGPAAYGRIDRSGALVRLGGLPQAFGGLWSPDGRRFAFQPFGRPRGHPPLVWSDGGLRPLQIRHAARIVGWESPRRVVYLAGVRGHRSPTHPAILIRCDAGTGACEQAGPPIPRAVLPTFLG